jgi:hypothetical protein
MRRARSVVPVLVTLALVAAPAPSWAGKTPAPLEGIPRFQHVAVIVLENEDYDATFGPGSPAHYLSSLVPQGVLATDYYATGHVSLDNYIAMTSGLAANPLTSSDCETVNFWTCVQAQDRSPTADPSAPTNVADQLEATGRSWKEYADGTFAPCVHAPYDPSDPETDPYQGDGASPGPDAGPNYADRHNPFIYYDDIVGNDARCKAHVVPYTQLATDLSSKSLPSFSFITPDTCNDGHDSPCGDKSGRPGGLATADAWLSQNVPPLLSYLQKHDGLLVITLDEADPANPASWNGCCHGGPGGGHGFGGKIGLLALGSNVRAGQQVSTQYDHASLLRTIEDAFGITTYLNNAASSSAMADLFSARKR